MNKRLEKLWKKEKRFQFDRDVGFFLEKAFSRPIYGLLWWLWVFLFISFFSSPYGAIVERQYEASIKVYGVYGLTTAFVCILIVRLAGKKSRERLLKKNEQTKVSTGHWIALRAIPVLLVVCLLAFLKMK